MAIALAIRRLAAGELLQHASRVAYRESPLHFGSDGTNHSKVHTYWTQKWRIFIYELLKAQGILPLIETGSEGGVQ